MPMAEAQRLDFSAALQSTTMAVGHSNQQSRAAGGDTVAIPVTRTTSAMPDSATIASILATTLPPMETGPHY
jgi:hypothetical protein